MRLLLIRHGQIRSNVRGVLDTAVPGPELTPLGREQAEALPASLVDDGVGRIWASTALRARQTAEPLARELALDVAVRDGIREISAGDYEMSAAQRDVRAYIETVLSWSNGDRDVAIPGGENGHGFFERYDAVVDEAVRVGREEGLDAIALVSHGAAIRCWASARADNLSVEAVGHMWLDNTGVAVLEETPAGWTCVSWMGGPVSGIGATAPAGPAGEPVE
jgi:broad specificity phosphatase PhoE